MVFVINFEPTVLPLSLGPTYSTSRALSCPETTASTIQASYGNTSANAPLKFYTPRPLGAKTTTWQAVLMVCLEGMAICMYHVIRV
jgi:hypothetical protein